MQNNLELNSIKLIIYKFKARNKIAKEIERLTRVTLQVIIFMIKSFAHKGLKDFFETGSKKGIQPEHASKLARIMDRLDASVSPQDMDLPGYKLHSLKGNKKDFWAVTVNGNWRVIFYFEGHDAYLVDYLDYH